MSVASRQLCQDATLADRRPRASGRAFFRALEDRSLRRRRDHERPSALALPPRPSSMWSASANAERRWLVVSSGWAVLSFALRLWASVIGGDTGRRHHDELPVTCGTGGPEERPKTLRHSRLGVPLSKSWPNSRPARRSALQSSGIAATSHDGARRGQVSSPQKYFSSLPGGGRHRTSGPATTTRHPSGVSLLSAGEVDRPWSSCLSRCASELGFSRALTSSLIS
jgi:hypothetical protein